jgi:hypothetical protein
VCRNYVKPAMPAADMPEAQDYRRHLGEVVHEPLCSRTP